MLKHLALLAALVGGGFVPMSTAQLNSTDKTFAMELAKANNYEIQVANRHRT